MRQCQLQTAALARCVVVPQGPCTLTCICFFPCGLSFHTLTRSTTDLFLSYTEHFCGCLCFCASPSTYACTHTHTHTHTSCIHGARHTPERFGERDSFHLQVRNCDGWRTKSIDDDELDNCKLVVGLLGEDRYKMTDVPSKFTMVERPFATLQYSCTGYFGNEVGGAPCTPFPF